MKLPLFLFIIFCSAFLLFQIQPILTKELLPKFGGSASVWSAGMFFYQAVLLCGYLYAHMLSKFKLKLQFGIHSLLLIASLVLTFPENNLMLSARVPPVFQVMIDLAQQVGLAFFLLASTSVLMQHLHYRTSNNSIPYHWYALSNFASLVALISYPFVLEIHFSVFTHKQFWFLLYASVAIAKISLIVLLWRYKEVQREVSACEQAPTIKIRRLLLWFTLSATSSIMLIATTQMISTNIPPMPMVWILPLVIYLTSYTFCFSSKKTYQRALLLPLLIFAVLAGAMLYFIGSQFNAISQLILFSLVLLICCLICHGELRFHAPNNGSMTLFYVAIALGGAVGSLFTAVVAPMLFERMGEYILALTLVLMLYALIKISHSPKQKLVQQTLGWAGVCSIFITSYLALESRFEQYDIANHRNFYGYIAVKDVKVGNIAERRLVDGTTVHGSQPLKDATNIGSSYYQHDSGVGEVINYLKQQEKLNIGIIGLGAGVLASYSRPNDQFHFYELNPAVYTMAKTHFSYLNNAQGSIQVEISDGRQALQKRLAQKASLLDAIIIDAFSSDVIPAHLLTQEAFQIYWQALKPDGLVLLHISNNHIDLTPVLAAHGRHFDKELIRFHKSGELQNSYGSEWVAISNRTASFSSLISIAKAQRIENNFIENPITWTDSHYSVLPLIKY